MFFFFIRGITSFLRNYWKQTMKYIQKVNYDQIVNELWETDLAKNDKRKKKTSPLER